MAGTGVWIGGLFMMFEWNIDVWKERVHGDVSVSMDVYFVCMNRCMDKVELERVGECEQW